MLRSPAYVAYLTKWVKSVARHVEKSGVMQENMISTSICCDLTAENPLKFGFSTKNDLAAAVLADLKKRFQFDDVQRMFLPEIGMIHGSAAVAHTPSITFDDFILEFESNVRQRIAKKDIFHWKRLKVNF